MALEKKFGQLETEEANFECVGVMHESNADNSDVWTHQQHYVPQHREIRIAGHAFQKDEEKGDEDLRSLHVSCLSSGMARPHHSGDLHLRLVLAAPHSGPNDEARQGRQPAAQMGPE